MAIKVSEKEREKLRLLKARKEAEATTKITNVSSEVTVVELPPEAVTANGTTWRKPASEWLRVKNSEYVEQLIKQQEN